MARLKSSICAIAHVDNDFAVGQVGQAPKLCCVMSLTACWLHTVGCTLLVRFVLCSDPPSFDPPPNRLARAAGVQAPRAAGPAWVLPDCQSARESPERAQAAQGGRAAVASPSPGEAAAAAGRPPRGSARRNSVGACAKRAGVWRPHAQRGTKCQVLSGTHRCIQSLLGEVERLSSQALPNTPLIAALLDGLACCKAILLRRCSSCLPAMPCVTALELGRTLQRSPDLV